MPATWREAKRSNMARASLKGNRKLAVSGGAMQICATRGLPAKRGAVHSRHDVCFVGGVGLLHHRDRARSTVSATESRNGEPFIALARRTANIEKAMPAGINTDQVRVSSLADFRLLRRSRRRPLCRHAGRGGPGVRRDYQLPAFAAAFLRSTCIAPARFNPWAHGRSVFSRDRHHWPRLSGLQLVHPGDVLRRCARHRRHVVATGARTTVTQF